jgi:ferritin
MMISEKMNLALNRQATNEFTASHNYLAMACSFREMGLKVFLPGSTSKRQRNVGMP